MYNNNKVWRWLFGSTSAVVNRLSWLYGRVCVCAVFCFYLILVVLLLLLLFLCLSCWSPSLVRALFLSRLTLLWFVSIFFIYRPKIKIAARTRRNTIFFLCMPIEMQSDLPLYIEHIVFVLLISDLKRFSSSSGFAFFVFVFSFVLFSFRLHSFSIRSTDWFFKITTCFVFRCCRCCCLQTGSSFPKARDPHFVHRITGCNIASRKKNWRMNFQFPWKVTKRERERENSNHWIACKCLAA